MRAVIQGWTGPGFLVRLGIVLMTGVAWAVQAVQMILVQPEYLNPETAGDYFTVYAYSASLLLTAASLLTVRDVARPLLAPSSAILVVAGACALAGVANALEDGLGLKVFGLAYIIGVMVAALGMIVIAAKFWASPVRRLTFVPAVGSIALMTVNIGGGILGLVAWLGFGVILIRERLRPRFKPVHA